MLPTPNHSSLDAMHLQLSDDDDDDDAPLLTQPPTLFNTERPICDPARTAFYNNSRVCSFCNMQRINDYVGLRRTSAISEIDMMYLIRKTGEGKSLVMQGMASMYKGVTVTMVPLLGLGSDQDDKCSDTEALGVESYHLDEYRNNNALQLRAYLDAYKRENKTTIILFVSPQQLSRHSYWQPVIMSLAARGCISAFCIDEVHSTVHNYESFRPEFKTAMESVNELVAISRRNNPDTFYAPILAMSATFTTMDQQAFNNLIGRFPTVVMWGNMARRNISFHVNIAGDPLHSFSKDWIDIANAQPSRQSLVYSNSAQSCNGPIQNRLMAASKKLPFNNGSFISLTGDCGMMLKSYLMACFCGNFENDNDTITDNHPTCNNESSLLPIWSMPCTSAANCGVSSKNCTSCFRIGPPPSWHEMVQEMGRVDRLHSSEHGLHSYRVYINLNAFLSLWLRVHSESNANVRARQMEDLMEILTLLVLPRRCYHDSIEQQWRWDIEYWQGV
ncbi:hypothetical protein ACHAWU_003099 [Discostella pseudostelligera]|uniref:Helicase ATP-binding domain-containing protein n=1 Tax=Discostella pseudostelligera TaxID=259834 RepID=A0ABD3MNT3_9STRA